MIYSSNVLYSAAYLIIEGQRAFLIAGYRLSRGYILARCWREYRTTVREKRDQSYSERRSWGAAEQSKGPKDIASFLPHHHMSRNECVTPKTPSEALLNS